MNYLAFLRKSKAAYLAVIIGLFCVNFPKDAIANPNQIPIAAVLLPTVDSPTHLKQAQSILNAIRAELLKEKFPAMDSNYSAQLIARKERAWLKKCSYSPKCLGELGQKLNATILLSGNLEKSPTEGFILRWVALKKGGASFLGVQSISLPPRFSPQEYATILVRELVLPHAKGEEPELLALVPLSGASTIHENDPQEPSLVIPPPATPPPSTERSPLFTAGFITALGGGVIMAAAGCLRIKSAVTESEIEPDMAQRPTHDLIESAKKDFDLSLNLTIAGATMALAGAGLMGIDILVESDDAPRAQIEVTPGGIRFVGKF